MHKNRIDANVRCPSCNGPLYPRVLACEECGLRVEGDFVMNEFGTLTPDELHFLRVFINCEGRIKDMEAALGVSYPTVKAHLASIKGKLRLPGTRLARGRHGAPPEPSVPPAPPPPPGTGAPPAAEEQGGGGARTGDAGLSSEEILEKLDSGQVSYKEAVRLLRARKKGENHGDEE